MFAIPFIGNTIISIGNQKWDVRADIILNYTIKVRE